MRMVDDQIDETSATKTFDLPHDERFATGHQQGFRCVIGERSHALAEAGGEDHRLERGRAHQKV